MAKSLSNYSNSLFFMKKSTITKEMIEVISRGDQKAEIFAELLQSFGSKHQNLISQIMHFDYDHLKELYAPESTIKKDIVELMKACRTKGELYEHLYKKYGQKNNTLIISVLEKDYKELKRGDTPEKIEDESIQHMDYTIFFNLNEKLKIANKDRHHYHLTKEFEYNGKVLIGEIEIKGGKLFIGVTSYEDNTLLTVFNFITVLNSVFKTYFVLAISNLLSTELKDREDVDSFIGLTPMINQKIILKTPNNLQQSKHNFSQHLLNVFFTVDSEMATMTIIGEKYHENDDQSD
ncbi:MAG: hypothetical protein U9N62_09990 [Thermotogota bacterium]|nr:hypothetical protein [Thermotogota bacterium]